MTHATELVQNYRLAMRALWNEYYWADYRFRDSATVDAFRNAALPIFEALVHSRLEPLGQAATAVFGNGFRIVTSRSRGEQISGLQIIGGKGELVKGPLKIPPLKLTLEDFFDWEQSNWRDFRYYLTRIDAFEGREDLVGQQAIVDVLEVDILWGPE